MPKLNLERPLVVFDIESTGVNPETDRIVEISAIKISPDGNEVCNTRRLNPEMPIPPQATAIHGISDADVADAPKFRDIALKLNAFLADGDLCGYNIAGFDVPILVNEFRRTGIDFDLAGRRIIDAYGIYCKLYPRTLSGAYRFFCGKELENAHSALADTRATWEVLNAQLEKHDALPGDLDALAKFCDMTDPDAIDRTRRFKWQGNIAVVGFGKNAGRALKDVAVNDPGFLRWIIRSDFPAEVKKIAEDALVGIFPERKA